MKHLFYALYLLLAVCTQSYAQETAAANGASNANSSQKAASMIQYRPKLQIGETAPNFTLPVYNGKKKISLSDYKGKYVLVDFWATWCGDCRREMPVMEEALKKYAGKIEVLSVSFDKKKESLSEYIEKNNIKYPVVCDYSAWKESAVAKAYQLGWIPTFYIVGPDGKIAGCGITGAGLKRELECIFDREFKSSYKTVYRDENVEFQQIDEHTWHGFGNLVYSESVYLIEGDKDAILIDAGAKMPGLKAIAESIAKKPVQLVISHAHGDHTGAVEEWDELWINAADEAIIPSDYVSHTKRKFMTDGMVFDLGNREIEVVFTPGHTPGSTTFIDRKNQYGFSSDAFGSTNLLVFTNLSTQAASCKRLMRFIEKYGVKYFFPGHSMGQNFETPQRVADIGELCEDILNGKKEGVKQQDGGRWDYVLDERGVKINYSEDGKR